MWGLLALIAVLAGACSGGERVFTESGSSKEPPTTTTSDPEDGGDAVADHSPPRADSVVTDPELAARACSAALDAVFGEDYFALGESLAHLADALRLPSAQRDFVNQAAELTLGGDPQSGFGYIIEAVPELRQLVECDELLDVAGVELLGIEPRPRTDDEQRVALEAFLAVLAEEMESWRAFGPSTYHYELNLFTGDDDIADPPCWYGSPLDVQVTDGQIESARAVYSGCLVDLADPFRPPLSVEEVVERFGGAIESGTPPREVGGDFNEHGAPVRLYAYTDDEVIDVQLSNFVVGREDTSAADAILAELSVRRADWAASGITSYRLTLELGCFCFPRGPFTATVVDGVVAEITEGDGGEVPEFVLDWVTVDGLFLEIERRAHNHRLDVTYDGRGFPITIDSDPDRNSIDEEITFSVTDFEVLSD